MVWKFLDLSRPKAARKRRLVVERIDHWWQEFRAKLPDLDALFRGRRRWDLPAWVRAHLQGINRNLMWEFGQDPATGGLYLVITPEAKRSLRPLVETILERAPRLDGWTFYAHRQAEPLEMAGDTVRAKTGRELALAQASARIGDLHRIDLVFQPAEEAAGEGEALLGQAFAVTESLLGEELLDRWVGAIDIAPSLPGGHGFPLERLRGTVEALAASIREQLPDRPCQDLLDEVGWTLFKREPEEAEDYPGQEDLLVFGTMLPGMWQCAHLDSAFYSARYSRCGETFCYLKIDGTEGRAEEEFADRSEIEEALNEVLGPARAGCVIGGGTGLRYGYIDLALTDVRRGSDLVRQRLRAGNISKRSWLLFHDCEWAREWVGLWGDTPPPPR